MAIQQGQCTVFKQNCLSGLENFSSGTPYTYKIALYDAFADLNSQTIMYSAANEITGAGYTVGGLVLTPIFPAVNQQTAYVSFEDVSWAPAFFTCRGALIYNSTTGAAVCVLNFGSDKVATGAFTIKFPPATFDSAVLRIS